MRLSLLHSSLRALCLLPALALSACDPKLKVGEILEGDTSADSTGTGGGIPMGSSGDATSSGTTTNDDMNNDTSGTTGTTGSGSSGEPPADDTHAPIQECDLWAQDCPGGEKCAPWADGGDSWNALKCAPIDPMPRPLGSSCEFTGEVLEGVDNCEFGLICWDVDPDTGFGTCIPQCVGSPDQPECNEGQQCSITNDAVLALCLPGCSPLEQDCPGDDLCIDVGAGFICLPDGSADEGQVFDPCEVLNGCDPGLACVLSSLAVECNLDASACCLPLCDLSGPNDCPGAGQECVSWYGDETPPVGKENVGLCQLTG